MLLSLTPTQLAAQFPLSTVEKPVEKPRPLRCAELCAVCGDQSTGYHYEVPSCNGCKTFFRRTIVSERQFKCHKEGKCLFNKDIRCACRSCRFKKCLEVGMNPKAIQTSRNSNHNQNAAKDTNVSPSTSPDQQVQIRKRGYDISSLLDMQPTCSRSISPADSVNRVRVDTTIIETCTDIEDKLAFLRKTKIPSRSSILDVLTKPCVAEHSNAFETSTLHFLNHDLDYDRETNFVVEYAKYYNWFRDLDFTDKIALLCDRTLLLVALRISYRKACNPMDYPSISPRLQPAIDKISKIKMDRVSFSVLNAILFLDCDSFSLSPKTREHLSIERQKHSDALGYYLIQRFGNSGPHYLAEHISLLWVILQCTAGLRHDLPHILPIKSITRQLLGHFIPE